MSKNTFTKEDIIKLKRNKNVEKVTEHLIFFTYDFKVLFIEEDLSGKFPREIFAENGIDINIIGYKRIEKAAERWRRAYKKDGILGLHSKKTSVGIPISKELTKEE